MRKSPVPLALLVLVVMNVQAELTFVQPPSIVYNSGNNTWTVGFEVSESTDVEVVIIDMRDSTILRHLAAGVLGANPPPPLAANALAQTLEWDGRDDLGDITGIAAESATVRVRAGMSVALDRFVGGSPYAFKSSVREGYFMFNGLWAEANGSIFVFASSGAVGATTIRKFDGAGNYLRTVYPYSADLQAADVSGWGINLWVDGKYSPKCISASYGPVTTRAINVGSGWAQKPFLPIGLHDEIIIGGPFDMNMISASGALPGSGLPLSLITSPAPPRSADWPDEPHNCAGSVYAAASHDTNTIYLSGYCQATLVYGMLSATFDTGFWKDGCVYKINRTTGIARQWISLDSVPTTLAGRAAAHIGPEFQNLTRPFTAIHGVAEDSHGRVYICDRFHRRVGVYDTSGAYLGGISVDYPDNVAINEETGEIFVTTCYQSETWRVGEIRLNKYSSWQSGGTLVSSLLLTTVMAERFSSRPHLVLSKDGANTVVWIGNLILGVRCYRDDGSSLTLVRDFNAETGEINLGFDRLAVDRKNETVFINDSWASLFKIEDWSNPVLTPCSTSAGTRLTGVDVAVSPDRRLYVREDRSGFVQGGWRGPVTRYTLDRLHAPVNYANTSDNRVMSITGRYGAGYAARGFAVSTDGRIAFGTEMVADHNMIGICADTGRVFSDIGTYQMPEIFDTTIYPAGGGDYGFCAGVKFDLKGNLYVGAKMKTPAHVTPQGFAGDAGYATYVGSLVRYKPGARGSMSGYLAMITGADTIYNEGIGPFSGRAGAETNDMCMCRRPIFDVDPFGRLFLPNAITNKITVTDNNGNRIVQFGDYGNWDSQGEGSLVPTPSIPLGWPVGVAASENYMYITDLVNTRLVRVKMNYALDNAPWIPDAAVHVGANNYSPLQLNAAPNPFNPRTRVTIRLSRAAKIRLDVYDVSGRFVKTIAQGQVGSGSHSFVWDATDSRGGKVSAGIYLLKLTTGKETLMNKVILAR